MGAQVGAPRVGTPGGPHGVEAVGGNPNQPRENLQTQGVGAQGVRP